MVSWYFCTWFERPLSNRTGKSRGGNTWCQIGSQRSFHSIHARLWSIKRLLCSQQICPGGVSPHKCLLKKGKKKFKRNLILGCFLMGVGEGSPASSCLLLLLLLQSRQLRLRPEFPLHWLSAKFRSMSRTEKFQTPHGLQCVT